MSTVKLEYSTNHVGVLTLDRPEAANAFSLQLLNDLHHTLDKIEQNHELRALIITGNGQKAFCAGADLKEREHMNDNEVMATVRKIKDTITRIEDLEIPTIAAINGAAFGGGLELALGCDIRIARRTGQNGPDRNFPRHYSGGRGNPETVPDCRFRKSQIPDPDCHTADQSGSTGYRVSRGSCSR